MNRREEEIPAGLCPQNPIHTDELKKSGNSVRTMSSELHKMKRPCADLHENSNVINFFAEL
jgi:hypothetical protein